jgi:hypothetical protein
MEVVMKYPLRSVTALALALIILVLGAAPAMAQTLAPQTAERANLRKSLEQQMTVIRRAPPAQLPAAMRNGRSTSVRTTWTLVGAVVGAAAGAFAGGIIGAKIEGNDCGCDDPGFKGFVIGFPIGGVIGGIAGGMAGWKLSK